MPRLPPRLHTVLLNNSPLTTDITQLANTLVASADMPRLQELDVASAGIGSDGGDALAAVSGGCLSLYRHHTTLNLRKSTVTDEGILASYLHSSYVRAIDPSISATTGP
ncbi:hypothetical protein H257_02594 [Aphanomyces astaci]|uniref:Uncharacterized protein n=1 Tax=Aphanomyces astaci TaxID=112090 RepID=W4H2P1_APHAT|nr:hypothetical protein H257_02594 [Aphanomyces astaci]ETV86132.1 hypothetical protein H257_02594 [Aphanomyces astaci]|eukprot:XP_009824604.1 hypothetical protein H257_02594 [Aphanomyces astaci]